MEEILARAKKVAEEAEVYTTAITEIRCSLRLTVKAPADSAEPDGRSGSLRTVSSAMRRQRNRKDIRTH